MLVPHQELSVAGPEAAPQPMEGEDLSLLSPSVLVCSWVYVFLVLADLISHVVAAVVVWFLLLVVAQTEPANTAESQPPEDPQTSRFTWTIESFSRLNTKKHYSDVFVVGGYKW